MCFWNAIAEISNNSLRWFYIDTALVRSPQKPFMLIIFKQEIWIKVSKKHLKTKALVHYFLHGNHEHWQSSLLFLPKAHQVLSSVHIYRRTGYYWISLILYRFQKFANWLNPCVIKLSLTLNLVAYDFAKYWISQVVTAQIQISKMVIAKYRITLAVITVHWITLADTANFWII